MDSNTAGYGVRGLSRGNLAAGLPSQGLTSTPANYGLLQADAAGGWRKAHLALEARLGTQDAPENILKDAEFIPDDRGFP